MSDIFKETLEGRLSQLLDHQFYFYKVLASIRFITNEHTFLLH